MKLITGKPVSRCSLRLLVLLIGKVILLGATARSATSSQADGPDGQAYWVIFPSRAYRQPVHSFGDVDFKNFTVDIYGPDGKRPDYSAKLANGRSVIRWVYPAFGEDDVDVDLGHVNYIGSPLHRRAAASRAIDAAYAVTTFRWTTIGATGTTFEGVNLYKILGDRAVLVQQIGFNQDIGTGTHFDPAKLKLTITAAGTYMDTGPPCCHLHVVSFKWTGHSFEVLSSRTFPYPRN